MIEAILPALESARRRVVLDHEADVAFEALADLYLATKTCEAMVTSQWSAGDRDGAIAAFRAADQSGWPRDHQRATCLSMTGVDLATDNASTDR